MAPCPCRNPLRSTGYRDPDTLGDSEQGTPAPSNAGPPDAPVSDAPIPAPVPAKYTEEAFQTMTMFCMTCSLRLKPVVANLQATRSALEKCKDHVDTTGAFGTNCTPFADSFICDRISFCWHQHMYQSQAVGLLPWVEFKAFLQKSQDDSRASVYTT